MKIRVYILTLLILAVSSGLNAQEKTDSVKEKVDTLMNDSSKINVNTVLHRYIEGVVIGVDVVSPVMYLANKYGSVEGMLKANIKNTYFPCFEAGFANADYTDDETDIKYKTTAPYFRAGMDYNILKDKTQRSHVLFAGARYGFSTFKYDYSGVNTDPVLGTKTPFSAKGLKSTCHWAELLVGAQVSVWKNFHMAWTVRYKTKIKFGGNKEGDPYYVPGFGTTTNNTVWGVTYHLIWNLRWDYRSK